MDSYDVIVLGLGAMGSAAAYQLAKAGKNVLGIDQFSPPHTSGSSYGDTRSIRQAIGEGSEYVPLVMRSYELWREMEKETGETLLTTTGGLIISTGDKSAITHMQNFFENTVGSAKTYNLPHDLLTANQIRARFPQFNVSSNEMGYFEKNAGFLRPEACITAQITLAKKYGAKLHTEEKVLSYEDNGNDVIVTTDKGTYRGGKLIIAAGAWLPMLLSEKLRGYFTVYRQVVYWFEPKEAPESFALGTFPVFIWESSSNTYSLYGFPLLDPKGGVKLVTEQYETTTTPEAVNRTVSNEEIDTMYKNFVEPNFPNLSNRCQKAVACLYTVTPDAGFVIDMHPENKNVIIASPCSGHGFKHAPAIGETLAQLATTGTSTIDISTFSLKRFLASS